MSNSTKNNMEYPLPKTLIQIIQSSSDNIHPMLYLDKLHFVVKNQEDQLKILVEAANHINNFCKNKRHFFAEYHQLLKNLHALTWEQKTQSDLALHLSRSNVLENAGTCLHPIYGLPYLPGSGLKGMARSYAETVWKEQQNNKDDAACKIQEIFGISEKPQQTAGKIVFHDAILTLSNANANPIALTDIVNCHFPKYYKGENLNHPENAPGDWQSPVPVYFLAIRKGTAFTFAISKRDLSVEDHLLLLAKEWLQAALCFNGAGAKTNSGYGYFDSPISQNQNTMTHTNTIQLTKPSQTQHQNRKVEVFQLTLETEAFFAGAMRNKIDCELRPASLRGMLRWWWRTMYSGLLTVEDLYDLEMKIWGSSKQGSAIQIELECESPPPIPNQVSTLMTNYPNIKYWSYGMYNPKSSLNRFYLCPNVKWSLIITTKPVYKIKNNNKKNTNITETEILYTKDEVMEQAKMALWLLTTYGAVGGKSTKGFGSLSANIKTEFDLDTIKSKSKQFLKKLNNKSTIQPQIYSPSIHYCKIWNDVPLNQNSSIQVMNSISQYYESIAKIYKHNDEKALLGLPRKDKKNIANYNKQLKFQSSQSSVRYTSPIRFHFYAKNGSYFVNIIAFEPPFLADNKVQNKLNWLKRFVDNIVKSLQPSHKQQSTGR